MIYALAIIMTMVLMGIYGYTMYSIGKAHGMDRVIIKIAKAEGVIDEMEDI